MEKLQQYLCLETAPAHFDPYQLALWYDAKGDWEAAHEQIQDLPGEKAAHLHAYLHRKEGDIWNADYWYQRARRKRPAVPLEEEFEALVEMYCQGDNL